MARLVDRGLTFDHGYTQADEHVDRYACGDAQRRRTGESEYTFRPDSVELARCLTQPMRHQVYKGTALRPNGDVAVIFDEHQQLAKVVVEFRPSSAQDASETYDHVREGFVQKYGPPVRDSLSDTESKIFVEALWWDQTGNFLSVEQRAGESTWGETSAPRVRVNYESPTWGDVVDRRKQRGISAVLE